ncbi:MAG: DUF1801 domain-containing protein [Eudoraea sp.]|nr:DUF1801 domain-containing protein [Eudoraea sp.]
MSGNKTIPTTESVDEFLASIPDVQKRMDCITLQHLMKEVTKEDPVMWGSSIVGFGEYHYKYDSGREGDMLMTGFSPRSQNISIYIIAGFKRYEVLMKKLGKHKTGKSCLYVKRLSDIDLDVLKELIAASHEHIKNKYHPV